MADADTKTKIIAGIVAVVLGLGLLAYFVDQNDEEGATTSCTLTAGGVTAIAVGLSRSANAQAIIATSGGALGSLACRSLVDTLIEDPTTSVQVEVQLGSQNTQQTTVFANSFLPPLNDAQTCFDWIDPNLETQCLLGAISPPPF